MPQQNHHAILSTMNSSDVMEHEVAMQHAHAMEFVDALEYADSELADTEYVDAMEHFELPDRVLSPKGLGFRHDSGTGSSTLNEERHDSNAHVPYGKRGFAQEIDPGVWLANRTKGHREAAIYVSVAAERKRIPTPYIPAISPPTSMKPERVPTPMPFSVRQRAERRAGKLFISAPDNDSRFGTSPARLQRISSTSSTHLELFPSPPRSPSAHEENSHGKAPALSPETIDPRRPMSISSTGTATPLHPGIRTPFTARYEPLHYRAGKKHALASIDSVMSPSSSRHSMRDVSTLRNKNSFASPVPSISPPHEESPGQVPSVNSEQFDSLSEDAETIGAELVRMPPRPPTPAVLGPQDIESSPPPSPASEARVMGSLVSEALTGDIEVDEVLYYEDWKKALQKAERYKKSVLGRLKGFLGKIRSRGGISDGEGQMEERRGLLGRLKGFAKIGLGRRMFPARTREMR